MNGPDVWDAYDGLRARDFASLTRDQQLLVRPRRGPCGGQQRRLRLLLPLLRWRSGSDRGVDAAREIGCPALAELIEEGMSRLGASGYPVVPDARADRLDELEVEFDDLDQRFYDVEAHVELDALMGQLARRFTQAGTP